MKVANPGLPLLYQRGKGGEVRVWRVWTDGAYVCTEAGVLNGKLTSARRRCEPKNVGRSNATTAEQQAVAEAQADWTHKRDRKYSETIPAEDTTHVNMPMLAHPFFVKGKPGTLTGQGKKVEFPADVQVKLDGVRAKARRVDGKVVLFPRSGQLDECYDMRHIVQQLDHWLPADMEIDGELYLHGLILQQITSLAKRWQVESTRLQYHVYDVPMFEGDRDMHWAKRCQILRDHIKESSSVLSMKTIRAANVDEVVSFARRFRERGFEGAMVRCLDGVYECGHRSAKLLKVKEHLTDEFEVIGCEEGVGKDEGTATFVCMTNEKMPSKRKEFRARMRGTLEARRAFFANAADYIGEKLTVSFMRWTEEGKPQEPVGEAFRAKRDLS